MGIRACVTYYFHSGFSVQVDDTLLVFDYWEGEHGEVPAEFRLTKDSFSTYNQVYVFVSHPHPDHLDSVIFTWLEDSNITYIVSSDMPIGVRGKRIAKGDSLRLSPDVRVTAYGSTDMGVSFLVDVKGLKVFHAGDLNLWHWREESSLREIEAAEKAYEEAVAPILGQQMDICMFPVDPRMGALFDAGANHFILALKPRLMIPMHWQGRSEVAVDFARRARNKATEVIALTKAGEFAQLTFEEKNLVIQIVSPADNTATMPKIERKREDPELAPSMTRDLAESTDVTLDVYNENDPFVDTDLPVALEDDNHIPE